VGVVPLTVELEHVTEPPPLSARALFVELSVIAVLAGSIVVADADPATPQAAIRAVAKARPSFLKWSMRETPVRGKPSCSERVSRDTRAGLAIGQRR
jgi:hypothetical protein